MNTSFSHALRVIICSACGGAMHVAVEGGSHACDVCAQEHDVAPRAEPEIAAPEESEDEREAALRASDSALPDMPEDVTALTEDEAGLMLRQDAAEEAMAVWQKTREELGEDDDVSDAKRVRFFHVTMLLYRHMKAQQDDLQLRGLLESALELTSGHRDSQIFRCVLARAAALAGDLTAADDWLAPCDQRSRDLHADSAYRYTGAYIATYKRQYPRVLELLGMRVGEVPLADNLDLICTVLRANAHERNEDEEAATLELADGMNRIPHGPREVERVIRSAGKLVLCRKSFVRARRRYDQLNEGTRQTTMPASAPMVKRAVPWVVLSLFFLGLAIMTDKTSTLSGGQRLDLLFFVLAAAFAVPLVVLIVRRPS